MRVLECPDRLKEWCIMELCRDCGHKNIGAVYCAKCGSALYRRKARPNYQDDGLYSLSRWWSLFAKRD